MATDHSKKSQCDQILAYLKKGKALTQLEALRLFGVLRLGARVKDLRDRGYPITSEMIPVSTSRGGTARVARYRLAKGWKRALRLPAVAR